MLLIAAAHARAAITLQDPAHFQVVGTFTVSPALPRPVGGLRFSADGATLYVVGAADLSTSALYRMAVTRNATTHVVTALGAPVKVFNGVNPDPTETEAGLDAGLEFGPAGTFFYTYFPTNFVGQRPGGVAGAETARSIDALVSVSGLTFAPSRIDSGTGFGYLHVSTGLTSNVYEVPLVAGSPAGTYLPNPTASIRLFARVQRSGPPRVGGSGVVGMQYVPAGTFAGDLLYASFIDKELWSVRIADATGLPIGGTTTPVEDLFATGFTAPPFGLEFDPITGNELFVSTWDDTVDGNNQILQIAGFASTAPTTTLPPTTTTSTTTSTSTTRPTTTSTSTTRPTTTSTTSSTSTSSSTTTTRPTTTSTTATIASTTSTSTTRPTTSSTSTSTSTTRPTTTSTTSSTSTSSSTTTTRPTTSSTSTSTSTTRPTTTSTSTTTTRPTTTSTSRPTSSTTSTSTSTSTLTTTTLVAPILIRTSSMTMRDRTGPPAAPARRKFVFRASTGPDGPAHGVAVPPRGSLGDPTSAGAILDVYNAAGSGELVSVVLPASGWTAYGDAPTPGGYRFTAASRSEPVVRLTVRADRIRIRAGGAAWSYTLDEPAQGAVAVRLRLGTAAPWCARASAKTTGFPPSSANFDRVDRFVAARSTPPPASCPPVP